jgi:hypothetical protein
VYGVIAPAVGIKNVCTFGIRRMKIGHTYISHAAIVIRGKEMSLRLSLKKSNRLSGG